MIVGQSQLYRTIIPVRRWKLNPVRPFEAQTAMIGQRQSEISDGQTS